MSPVVFVELNRGIEGYKLVIRPRAEAVHSELLCDSKLKIIFYLQTFILVSPKMSERAIMIFSCLCVCVIEIFHKPAQQI